MHTHILSNDDVRRLMKQKVHTMARRVRSPVFDHDDFEQYLISELLAAAPAFDPARGTLLPFVAVVLRRAISRFVREHRSLKRSGLRSDRPVESVSDPHADYDRDLTDLRLSLDDIGAMLTPDQWRLVQELQNKTLSQLAREMNIPRTTLQSRVRALRAPFAKRNLEDFL